MTVLLIDIGDIMRVISLFSGIGAFEQALTNLNIPHEVVHYCEIDKYASKSYSTIHNVPESINLGDITTIDIGNLPTNIDLLTHGSPCQDFSVAGNNKGGDIGSNTRSSLMWNSVEIIKHCKPKYVIWENVKGVLQKSQIHNYEKYISTMEQIGYKNYSKLINSKYFGVAQDRERLFVVSIRSDIDKTFEFPDEYDYLVPLSDVLEKDVDSRFLVKKVLNPRKTKKYIQYDNSGKGYDSQAARLYYLHGQMCTLPKCNSGDKTQVLLDENTMTGRRITPYEAWMLMGFSKEDYLKAEKTGQTMGRLYGQAGNSIVISVLEGIFRNLLC